MERRYLDALSLTPRNVAVPKTNSQNKATGDAHWMCNTCSICISRGLRRCSSLTIRAMPQPLGVGRVTDQTPTLFCILAKLQSINRLEKGVATHLF